MVQRRVVRESLLVQQSQEQREDLLDKCFWNVKCHSFINTKDEILAHLERKLPLLKESMVSGAVEHLNVTERKIVDALRRREAYNKIRRDHPLRSALLAMLVAGPHWNLLAEDLQLGPSIQELEELIWERDLVHVKMGDAAGYEGDYGTMKENWSEKAWIRL